jgi:GH15 family glucan-1,4-alpha-glucosidase
MTLDRAGYHEMAARSYGWLHYVCDRSQGWWYQKYTTDGQMIWGHPQVDTTAIIPFGCWYHYLMAGDAHFLREHWPMIKEACYISSQDSHHPDLFYDESTDQMCSQNLWEDQIGEFLYSNSVVEAGLRAGASAADLLGYPDGKEFQRRADRVHQGLLARIDYFLKVYDQPPTVDLQPDTSMLGLCTPFGVLSADDPRMVKVEEKVYWYCCMDEHDGLMRRYNGPIMYDDYFGGGPWTVCTLWHGQYFAELADVTQGAWAVDVLKHKIDLIRRYLGFLGLGAEQIDVEGDFHLEAAWPNTWESMASIVDSMLKFVDYEISPGKAKLEPKLPEGWNWIECDIPLTSGRLGLKVHREASRVVATLNIDEPVHFDLYLKIPEGSEVTSLTENGEPVHFVYDEGGHRVLVSNTGAGVYVIEVDY